MKKQVCNLRHDAGCLTQSNLILSRFFTQNLFFDVTHSNSEFGQSKYQTIVEHFIENPTNQSNQALISEVYRFMAKSYRNEYFYQNTLLNKLLLGRHSLNTTTALTQIPVGKSKADFVLINGKAVVYEIKTELDTFDRLETQLKDYYKGFNNVCVVTSERQYERAKILLKNTPVGIYVLTSHNTISSKLRKEPIEDNSQLNHTTIFKLLNKPEYEQVLLEYYGTLPVTSQVFYYGKCFDLFSDIPISKAYQLALKQLKKRNKICRDELHQIPYELKSLFYFSKSTKLQFQKLLDFLHQKYGD